MRLAAYCRVSTDHEEQLDSLENQKNFFEEFASIHNHELIKIYADRGISGKQLKNRERFQQMLYDARQGVFDVVAVKDIARFARNTLDFLAAIRELKRNNVIVLFVTNNMSTYGDSEFTLTIFGAIAQEESINISKRIRFGKKINAKKGRVPNLIYGYTKKDIFNLEIEEDEANTVRNIFELVQKGTSMRRIAAHLNEGYITTKKGCAWDERNIRRIIQNPIYKGVIMNHRTETKDVLDGTRKVLPPKEWYVHERPEYAIVSADEFDAAQRELERRRRKFKDGATSKRAKHHSAAHLFSNLVICSTCGSSFTKKSYMRKQGRREYWVCRCRDQGISTNRKKCTNFSYIDDSAIRLLLQKYFMQAIPDMEAFVDRICTSYSNQKKVRQDTNRMQIDKLHDSYSKTKKREERIQSLYVNGFIEIEELQTRQELQRQELRQLETAIEACRNDHIGMGTVESVNKKVENMLSLEVMTNAGLKRIIDRIEIGDDNSAKIFIVGEKECVAIEKTGNLNLSRK